MIYEHIPDHPIIREMERYGEIVSYDMGDEEGDEDCETEIHAIRS